MDLVQSGKMDKVIWSDDNQRSQAVYGRHARTNAMFSI